MVRRTLRRASIVLLLVAAAAGCGSSNPGVNAGEDQRNFGVRMAKMNLWREAMFRFKRAVEMNPNDAMAHNNLAVAYEANGDFESALKEYREAMRIDKSNQFIAKNYSRYVEFTQRNKKRQKRDETKAAAAANATAPVAPTTPEVQPAVQPPTPPSDTAPGPSPVPTAAAPAAQPPSPPPPTTPPTPEKPPGGSR